MDLSDALMRRLLGKVNEDPEDITMYLRESWHRDAANMEQVEPHLWFQLPKEWEPPAAVKDTYEALSGEDCP